jgi:hypothetical protein
MVALGGGNTNEHLLEDASEHSELSCLLRIQRPDTIVRSGTSH